MIWADRKLENKTTEANKFLISKSLENFLVNVLFFINKNSQGRISVCEKVPTTANLALDRLVLIFIFRKRQFWHYQDKKWKSQGKLSGSVLLQNSSVWKDLFGLKS